LRAGDAVEGHFRGRGRWFPGKIRLDRFDGTYDFDYDDEEDEDIGFAIQQHAEKHGYGVVRELVGHGLGKTLHEDPQVPNYGRRGRGKKILNGLTIAIEPMINMGTHKVTTLDDNWTIVTQDGLPSAHFEHDVAFVNGEPVVLSTFDFVYEALEKKND
jgi:methionyl aminopeptidase